MKKPIALLLSGLAIFALSGNAHTSSWTDMLRGIVDPETQSRDVGDLSEAEMHSGLQEALAQGVIHAVNELGQPGGYLDDAEVRIPLPGMLQNADQALRIMGQGDAVDEFIVTMNRAAERAVPLAADIVGDAVREMSITDAREILTGPDDAATQYFRRQSTDALTTAMRPIVSETTEQAGVTRAYSQLVQRAGPVAGMLGDTLDLDNYVTEQTLNGLFLKIAEQERAIRANPMGHGSALLERVFGTVRQ